MGMFNFFGEGEHKVFDYKPVYYDREEEERKRRFSSVDGSLSGKSGSSGKQEGAPDKGGYVPGSYIKGSFRDGNYQKSRSGMTRVHTVIGILTMLLIAAVLFFILKFYSML